MAGLRVPATSAAGGTPGISRVRCYLDDGAWYAVGEGVDADGVWSAVGTPVAMTLVAGGAKVSLSGTDLTIASGSADVAKPDPTALAGQGRAWYVALADLDVPAVSLGQLWRLDLWAGTRPTVNYGYVFTGLLTGAWADAGQLLTGGCISYISGKRLHYCFSTGNYGTLDAVANADYDRLAVEARAGIDRCYWGSSNTAKTSGAAFPAIAGTPGTGTVTHLGISAGAVYGATSASCTFGDPQVLLSWSPVLP